jgi:hypothetical protein
MEKSEVFDMEEAKVFDIEEAKAFAPDFDDIYRAIKISYATLTIISERRDTEIDTWAILGILEQIEKVKDYLSGIENVILNLDNNTEEQLVH